jgi:hypothetical protein
MSISTADHFVIVASQILVALSNTSIEFEVMCETILEVSQAAQQRMQPDMLEHAAEL